MDASYYTHIPGESLHILTFLPVLAMVEKDAVVAISCE